MVTPKIVQHQNGWYDEGMIERPGLRERKKRLTREQIATTAWRLFVERGFERVSVAEIAREADVAEATVFNYFPTKEDLVYGRMEAFGARMTEAIRGRPPGESVVDAFGRFVLEPGGYLASDEPDAAAALAAVSTLAAAVLTWASLKLTRAFELAAR